MASHFVYTPSEFRAKMRGAFEFAQAGATVVIDRYGEKFILKHVPKESPYIPDFKQEYTAPPAVVYDEASYINEEGMKSIKIPFTQGDGTKTVKEVTVQSTPVSKNSLAKAKQEVANLQAQQAIEQKRMKMDGLKFCKAGHILSDNGKCLQKGCKYGK